tara:strand:+ start:472 stop:711 length:240 start_codon:yes stop_codon:yes gene_type:complete
MEIIIYSKNNCPSCLKAKNLLKNYNPKILTLGDQITREEFLTKFPNIKSLPQIIINNKHIGGYNDLEKWVAFNSPNQDF